MKIKIKSGVLHALTKIARGCVERECCGALWYGLGDCVEDFTLYPGVSGKNDFVFADVWWMELLYRARTEGKTFAGLFHSHPPGCPTYPSFADRRGHSFCRTLIVSSGEEPARCFLLGPPESEPSEEAILAVS